ncbi:MAG: putative holin-like toxin [Lachnospiraceae bacterium]|nr:putative holin-like toxin [Lachnospiraceae bacterium]
MSVFEIVTIVLGVISLLISLGTLIITLLSYLNDKKQK